MRAVFTSLCDRPINDRERRSAITLIALLLAASVVLLAATRPATTPPRLTPQHRVAGSTEGTQRPAGAARGANAASVPHVAARVAEGFLRGYLAYLYGHAPAAALTDATPALLRSLRENRPLVSPAMRARYPRVLSLKPLPAPRVAFSALVNDGELASYHLVLPLAVVHGRLLVSAVQGE